MKTESTKANFKTGKRVYDKLTALGLETPTKNPYHSLLTEKEQIDVIERGIASSMDALNLDRLDDSLVDTPARVAKMWVRELFWGLDYQNFPKITVIDNKMGYDEMLVERRIQVMSTCEHHLLPIIGHAYVAYIPDKKVVGLSKFNRVVEFFSRRPQVQERLTAQIFHTLCELVETDNVAVTIVAEHFCVKSRGVEDPCSDTATTQLGGVFKKVPGVKDEFYNLCKL